MDLKTRQAVIRQLAKAYRQASKKVRGQMLDQVVQTTGYHRWRAAWLLTHPPKLASKKQVRRRGSKYTPVLPELRKLWSISNFACGKRLVGMLPEYVECLTRDGEMVIPEISRKLLLEMSAATIDRILKGERKLVWGKGRTTTKPGTLLKHQIPIQIFTRWDERKPGFIEMDLVAHCGPTAKGEFAYTLDCTDLDLCWDECRAVLGRGQGRVLSALQTIRNRMPMSLLGIDSDNDEVFINEHLYRWCQTEHITFTRSREYRKNDQAHVEEKNWSVVRKYIGYRRLDTQHQVDILNELYDVLRLYYNFFQANMKLERKQRDGGRVKRIYGPVKTPYARVLDHPDIPSPAKDQLRQKYHTLNPAALLRAILKITDQLTAG